MNDSFDLILSVYGHTELGLNELSSVLKRMPDSFSSESDVASSLHPKNYWTVFEKYRAQKDIMPALEDFIEKYSELVLNIADSELSFCFRISIVTQWAHTGFSLGEEVLSRLSRLGVPLTFSFFSWGSLNENERIWQEE